MDSLRGIYWLNTKNAYDTTILYVDNNSNNSVISHIDTALVNTVDEKIPDKPVAPI